MLRSSPREQPVGYFLVTTNVPIRTCGHSSSTSWLYIRMQPWLACVPITQGWLVPWMPYRVNT
jgi:hypothetical protein